jgi:hypothetical protein
VTGPAAPAGPASLGPLELRGTICGLLGFAATEEQVLLARTLATEQGDPANWAAAPLVAHTTEFKEQQVQRLDAVRQHREPRAFAEIEHSSPEVYDAYSVTPANAARASWHATGALLDRLSDLTDDDLENASRHSWLRGRHLWLQIVVRGFWHPTGHLAEYYLGHAQPERAIDLAVRGVATAAALNAPDMAQGMASYTLACVQARADEPEAAVMSLTAAAFRNPDVLANAADDPDLASLRDSGMLEGLLSRPAQRP